MTSLPRVRPGLLKHNVDEQELVYDPRADRVHLLDQTTACVLTLLQEDGWTPEGIAAELTSRLGLSASASLLPLAIQELRNADLLESLPEPVTPAIDVSRRELLKKVGLTGAAALLVPAIVTFTATPGYAQGTLTGAGTLDPGQPCSAIPGHQCKPGFYCYPSNPGFCAPQGCTVPGGTCAVDTTCCSNFSGTNNACNTGTNKCKA